MVAKNTRAPSAKKPASTRSRKKTTATIPEDMEQGELQLSPFVPTSEFLERLRHWSQAQGLLEQAKEAEAILRMQLFTQAFPELVYHPSQEGSFNIPLPHGWKLKTVVKLNTHLDEAALPSIIEQLLKNKVAVDDLFKYKPSIIMKAYKKLDKEAQQILSEAMSQSRGMPQMELVPPKQAS